MDRVLDAAELVRADNVARHTDDEEIAEAPIEQQLDGDPRVAATENGSEGVLRGRQTVSMPGALVSTCGLARHEALVPVDQSLERRAGRYRVGSGGRGMTHGARSEG